MAQVVEVGVQVTQAAHLPAQSTGERAVWETVVEFWTRIACRGWLLLRCLGCLYLLRSQNLCQPFRQALKHVCRCLCNEYCLPLVRQNDYWVSSRQRQTWSPQHLARSQKTISVDSHSYSELAGATALAMV